MRVLAYGGPRIVAVAETAVQTGLIALVQLYRWVGSPLKVYLLGDTARCRFAPSCSTYALVALQRHGVCVGAGLAARRICRCHPWGGQGADPVPEAPLGGPA